MAGPSKSKKQARFMALCAHGGGDTGKGPPCPKGDVAKRFNDADTGTKRLSEATKDINRTPKGNRFAPGLKGR